MYLLRAHTYFVGDDPSACVNCHIMTPYYATWSHSSHGRDATCNDCHVPINSMQITEDIHMVFDHLMMSIFYREFCGIEHIKD